MKLVAVAGDRHRTVIIGIVIAIALIGALIAGFILLRSTQSPAQRVADAEPPPSPTSTAQVEKRVLSVQTTLPGKTESGGGEPVQAPSLPDGGKLVVTDIAVGQDATVSAGTVLAEVSGYPIIAMPGKFPMYRGLSAGDSGPDVRQLQAALRELGFSNSDRKGTFGPGTARAVAKLFTNRKLDPSVLYSAAETSSGDDAGDSSDETQESASPAAGAADGKNPQTRDSDAQTMTIPAGLFSFHQGLPAQVGEISARVGAVLDDNAAILTLSSSGVRVAAEVPESTAAMVEKGMACTITLPEAQSAVDCTVDRIEDSEQEGSRRIVLSPANTDELKAGEDVSVAIEVETSGKEVLAVPVTAVRSEPGGASYLLVQADEKHKRTDITVGRTIGGWAEITSGEVKEGDTIVLQ